MTLTLQQQVDQANSIAQNALDQIQDLSSSSTIPYAIQTAFTERLGLPIMLYGKVKLVSGTATILDNRIRNNSICLVTSYDGASHFYSMSAALAGKSALITSSGTDTNNIQYLIII